MNTNNDNVAGLMTSQFTAKTVSLIDEQIINYQLIEQSANGDLHSVKRLINKFKA